MIRIIYRQYNEKTQNWEMNLAFPIYQAELSVNTKKLIDIKYKNYYGHDFVTTFKNSNDMQMSLEFDDEEYSILDMINNFDKVKSKVYNEYLHDILEAL